MEILKTYYKKGFGTIIPIEIKEKPNSVNILYVDCDHGGYGDLNTINVVSTVHFKRAYKTDFDHIKGILVDRIFNNEWSTRTKIVIEGWNKK